ncbi:Retron-type RNA-directed DNA polymerase [Minicystis rosea]|nr:Retron-type RNA-directed DNA polymerase [Minicystis rosea]
MASAAHQSSASSPFDRVVSAAALRAAWDHVRRSAESSASPAIRDEARRFAEDVDRRLARVADELADDRFLFAPSLGVARARRGKKPRPIVVAPIESRVVTRAILEVLLQIPAVADLCLGAGTSFGGLPGRGVPAAAAAALAAVRDGAVFYVRSDIAEFFRAIPRDRAVAEIARVAGDERLARLVDRATATELGNASELGDDATLFPGERRGVGQGNALSTLLGNVLLRDFDDVMNGRGMVCLRYVDDFLLLGPRAAHVKKAFSGAQDRLAALGLRAYDPTREPEKAAMGAVAGGIEWLGCEIRVDAVRPSVASRKALLLRIDRLVSDAERAGSLTPALAGIEGSVRAFRAAYGFCTCPEIFATLDARIDRRIEHAFRRSRTRLGPGLAKSRGGPPARGADASSERDAVVARASGDGGRIKLD